MCGSDLAKEDDSASATSEGRFGTGEASFWLFVWFGTALAGALFGLLLGLTPSGSSGSAAVIGALIGLILAGTVAVPMVLVMATASWAIGRRRWRTLLAIIAGSGTGILSSLPLAVNPEEFGFRSAAGGIVMAAVPGLLGAFGGWVAALAWMIRVGEVLDAIGEGAGCADAPVANRFVRAGVLFVVMAAVVATCLGGVCAVRQAREASQRSHCGNNLKQIWLCLRNYETSLHSLPPAYATSKAGKPTLSWRVSVAQCCFYNTDFSEWLDMGQPWNSPKNSRFFDGRGYFSETFHCPSSGKDRENALTDYVAVVGPDTLWPGNTPGDRKKHPKGILVVEWPKSDIHWAEPRDITVEEFLDWFRMKPADQNSFHRGGLLYVDAEGNVGELRNDTDPETVRRMLIGQAVGEAASRAGGQ